MTGLKQGDVSSDSFAVTHFVLQIGERFTVRDRRKSNHPWFNENLWKVMRNSSAFIIE